MKSVRTRKRRRDSKVRNSNRWRSGPLHPLQFETLESRQMLNGSSIVNWEPPAPLCLNATAIRWLTVTPS